MNDLKKFFSISIRGASHIKSGKPMQDYSLAYKGDDFCVGVVCDGHGADKHFRSEIGSEIAAHVAINKLIEFSELNSSWNIFQFDTQKKLNRLKLSIISDWQTNIESYTLEHQFTDDELKKASNTFKVRQSYDIAQPYGTTLLAAMICHDYYLVMMIGDGAIIKILPDFSSEIIDFPGKPKFEDQPHSATDSLCEPGCYSKIFFQFDKLNLNGGEAFALCSDGLSEAFSTDATLLAKINNYINYYAEEGMEKAKSAIEVQLNELSRISPMKDDISLVFVTNSLEKYIKASIPKKDVPQDPSREAPAISGEDSASVYRNIIDGTKN